MLSVNFYLEQLFNGANASFPAALEQDYDDNSQNIFYHLPLSGQSSQVTQALAPVFEKMLMKYNACKNQYPFGGEGEELFNPDFCECLGNYSADDGLKDFLKNLFGLNDEEVEEFADLFQEMADSGKKLDMDLIISSINRTNYRQLIANQLNSQTALTDFINNNNDPTNPNVYFNLYGYNGITQLVEGEWVHSRWNHYHHDEEQLVYRNGIWEPYYPSPTVEMHVFTAVLDAMQETGHVVLDGAGMFPGLGEIADGINAVWYFAEEDYVNGTLSSLSMVPFAGNAVTIGKWSKNALKWVKNAGIDFFVSPKGLKYLKSSNVDRVGHVFEHVLNNTAKPKHGVFDDPNDVIGIIDEAWQKKLDNGIEHTIDPISQNWNYVINLQKRVGWEGGYNGAGQSIDAKQILIAVKPNTAEVVTAFPML